MPGGPGGRLKPGFAQILIAPVEPYARQPRAGARKSSPQGLEGVEGLARLPTCGMIASF
jgi:hypothetical protein